MGNLMRIYLYAFGIMWVIMGALFAFATESIRIKFINKILKMDLKIGGTIAITLSILLIIAAYYNRYTLLIVFLGFIGVIKGVLALTLSEKVDRFRKKMEVIPNSVYKALGVFMIIVGSIVLMGI